eukprot:TRINITY_DN10414_c0_g1_i1.p1 TRINITY_DN10414_c0_g1~~TRINITY_DN10414_c0_g1_i1.p1  ORF type:complete len:595 (+),score=109.57 TRINITY_DN10414_c0_g1_i1:59-1843(+)
MEVGYPLPPPPEAQPEYVPEGPQYVEMSTPVDEDSWVYSRFALPMLLWVFLWILALFCLTFWQQTGDIKNQYNGLPRFPILRSTQGTHEAGQPTSLRSVRIASCFFGIIAIFGAFVIYFLRPKQSVRQGANFGCAFLLFLCSVLAWVAFGIAMANFQNQQTCPYNRRFTGQKCVFHTAYAIAAATLDAAVGVGAIISLLLLAYNTKANHWVRGPNNWEEAQQDAVETTKERVPGEVVQRNVGYVRRMLTGLALLGTLLCLIALVAFIILLHEEREHSIIMGPRGRGDRKNVADSNLPFEYPGWKTINTRIRYSLSGIGLGAILLNFLTFRSKTIAYIFAFLYFATAVLAMVAFGFDVHELRWANDLTCPAAPDGLGQDCTQGQFIATAVLDFFVFIWLIVYIVVEYVINPTPQCQHCDRAYELSELMKHEAVECGARPVRCEVCAKTMTKKQFDEHKSSCSSDHVRCKNCKVMVPKWGVKAHQEECPRWPVECNMCDGTFQRMDMPHHVTICPNRPTSCDACGETFRSKDIAAHRALCGEVLVRCELCDDIMQRFRLQQHTQNECPKRIVECDKCGESVTMFRWERHQQKECSC